MTGSSSSSPLSSAKRIVVKVGSALIADGPDPRQSWLNDLAKDIAAFRNRGCEVVLVSSGAIALGRQLLGPHKPKKLEEKQAAAALGQPLLMAALSQAFSPHDVPVAQSLLSLEDTENRRRWLNARSTLETLLSAGAIPVINENDTVATDEIRYGDNDRLAARVAQMVSADVLILLSDIDGLYTADPRLSPEAAHIPQLTEIAAEHEQMAGGTNTQADIGSGGMATKLAAARIAWSAGCATAITLGDRTDPLSGLLNGAKATWILPPLTPAKAREIWLRGHLTPEGAVFVDNGAARALRDGASLLAAGLTGIDGDFARGAAVAVLTDTGEMIGKGITAYSAVDARRILGLRSDQIADVLGYRGRPSIIHRNDLILEP
ncbi:MAG: glutamate 5-kinase [Henriciella sp.]|nr:glutamate 5-kinase [Henriciella sp.]